MLRRLLWPWDRRRRWLGLRVSPAKLHARESLPELFLAGEDLLELALNSGERPVFLALSSSRLTAFKNLLELALNSFEPSVQGVERSRRRISRFAAVHGIYPVHGHLHMHVLD